MASVAVARTHPLVLYPQMTSVSIPRPWSVPASGVPKNELEYCFSSTISLGWGRQIVDEGGNSPSGFPLSKQHRALGSLCLYHRPPEAGVG